MTDFANVTSAVYVEFWGKSRHASRHLQNSRPRPYAFGRKHKLQNPVTGKGRATFTGRKEEHARAVKEAVRAREGGKVDGILAPLPRQRRRAKRSERRPT